jgi:hypothetical protein
MEDKTNKTYRMCGASRICTQNSTSSEGNRQCLDRLEPEETGCRFGLATVVQDWVQQQAAFCECGNET